MNANAIAPDLPELEPPRNFYMHKSGLRNWLLTTDHKRIAILYAITVTLFFIMGGVAAAMIRINLVEPQGALLSAETYNKTFTFHGVVMVWFFLIPSIPATLGNFLLPIMIGARDLAFPRLNLASWYLFVIGGCFTIACLLLGGVDTGWTFYTPFSTMFSNTNVILVVVGVFVTGFSTILTGLNFIVTTHKLRMPGMTWFKLPLFVWAMYAVSVVMVLATPVLAMTLSLIGLERIAHVGIFDPALGGDPLLFQHMFWFYSHPAVYIMILPAMGVASEIIPCFARRKIFGYKFMVYALVGISVIGFLVWGHHMFVAGMSATATLVFSILSFIIAVPSAIKVFNWTATLRRGRISFEAPMLYALGFVGLFMLGGLTGLMLAAPALDIPLHATYFVIAHFHYVMVGGTVMAYLGGIHYWWPKITGRMYSEGWARFAAILMFFGFNLTFFPQYILGWEGMPRRYYDYLPQYTFWHQVSTVGSWIMISGILLMVINLVRSIRNGKPCTEPNPWGGGRTLEWTIPSPPPLENFRDIPVVNKGPYDLEPSMEHK